MKNPDPDRQLLEDVLAEGLPDAVYAATLSATLSAVRRKRRRAAVTRAMAVSTAIVLGAAVAWFSPKGSSPAPGTPPYQPVATQRLAPEAIVTTAMLPPTATVTTTVATSTVTTERGDYLLIGDLELLALSAPRSGVLVRDARGTRLLLLEEQP